MDKISRPSPSVDELLARWDEARQPGQTIGAEELCRNCPEQLEQLKRRIETLQSMEGFLEQGQASAQDSVHSGRSSIPSVPGAKAAVSAEPRPDDDEFATRPPAMAPDSFSTPPAGIGVDQFPTGPCRRRRTIRHTILEVGARAGPICYLADIRNGFHPAIGTSAGHVNSSAARRCRG